MLVEARQLPDGSTVEGDVTVVGAGPAGIVVSLELAAAGYRVTLAESGGPRYSRQLQELSDLVDFDPARHAPMAEATRRQIGGTSAIWGGRCLPYDRVDFDEREHIRHSGWPVQYEELERYFQKTADYFACGKAEFSIRKIPGIEQTSIVPGLPDGDVLTSSIERWSLPTNFGREYAGLLGSLTQLRLIHGLTCVEIECEPASARVAAIRGRTLGGKTIRLRSRKYVIACGGLETTRLLMASDRVHAGGIGNHSGQLGRFYMGHISGQIAQVQFTTEARRTVFAFDRDPDGVYLRRRFSFAREFQHKMRLPNIVGWLVNPKIYDPSHGNGILSFAYLALASPLFGRYLVSDAIRRAAVSQVGFSAKWPHVRNILRDLRRTLVFMPTFGYKRYVARRKVPGFFQASQSNTYLLHYHGEQVPNADSRVSLAPATDALGMRRLRVDLRYSEQDVDGVLQAHEHWDRHLRRHGCGSLRYLTADQRSSVWKQAGDGLHQCGTTRMSRSPDDGVVSPDGNVHCFDDLFVVSSSTFVTSGQANPTFMIVAFGLRLVDHLKRLLGSVKDAPSTRKSSRLRDAGLDVHKDARSRSSTPSMANPSG